MVGLSKLPGIAGVQTAGIIPASQWFGTVTYSYSFDNLIPSFVYYASSFFRDHEVFLKKAIAAERSIEIVAISKRIRSY